MRKWKELGGWAPGQESFPLIKWEHAGKPAHFSEPQLLPQQNEGPGTDENIIMCS